MNITDGIIRCRYRNSWTQPELLQPGEVVEVVIEPFATCNLFKKGHRLRLDIAGSNFLHFDCNRAALFPVVRFLFACIGYRQRLLLPGVMR